jgi:hypothetical protein
LSKDVQLVVDAEFQRLLIPLTANERDLLEKSLLRDGCLHPLTAWQENGKLILLDGHNRKELCEKHGIGFKFGTVELDSREWAKIWIRRNQLARRNLPDDARAMMGARLLKDLSRLAREQQLAEARQAKADRRSGKKASVSTAVVDTEKKARKDNLAEIAKEGNVSQRRVRLAGKIEKRAIAVMDKDAAQKVCDEIELGRLSLARAKRDLSKAEDAKKLLEAAKAVVRSNDEWCHCCSMEEFLGKARDIDCILTDPPYGKEYVGLYGTLAKLAATALKPNGVLAVMCGQSYLPEVLAEMTRHMRYRWEMAYLTPGGQAVQLWDRKVNTFWKPILIFGEQADDAKWLGDVVKSDANDKRFHEWSQSESGMGRLVEVLTEPGQLIADPFLGGGTTAVAALKLHRRIIGCDIDPKMVKTAHSRVALALAETVQ